MRQAFLSFAILSLFGCTAANAAPTDPAPPISSADETKEHDAREAIFAMINTAIAAKDFAALDALEQDYAASRERTPAGVWKLRIYNSWIRWKLDERIEKGSGCVAPMAQFVAEWRASSPHSPSAVITEASQLIDQASCFRGGDYADRVPPEAWAKFGEKRDAAVALLAANRELASANPEFYALELDTIGFQGSGTRTFDRVFAEATARYPDYATIYTRAALDLLPQWGGSYPQIEALVRTATTKSRASYGMGLYAQVFRELEECGCDVIAQAADWTTMKVAMRDLYARYPVRNNAEYFAKLACRMGDREEGRRYIRAQHPGVTNEDAFFLLFGTCDMQANQHS